MRSNRRAPKRAGRKTHLFKRVSYTEKYLQVTTAAPVTDEMNFRLTQVPANNEFTTLFDAYCIKMVKVELIPKPNVTQMGTAGAPQVHSVIDLNDSNALGGLNDYLQYETYKSTRGLQTHTRIIRPRVAATVFQGAIASGYMNPYKSAWIDTTTPGVQHYGLKLYVSPVDSGTQGLTIFYDLKVTYYLAMRAVR